MLLYNEAGLLQSSGCSVGIAYIVSSLVLSLFAGFCAFALKPKQNITSEKIRIVFFIEKFIFI